MKTIAELDQSAAGCLKIKEPVNRQIDSKYFMPDDLVNTPVYPNYFSGAGYLMNKDLVEEMQKVVKTEPVIPLDDTYIGKGRMT